MTNQYEKLKIRSTLRNNCPKSKRILVCSLSTSLHHTYYKIHFINNIIYLWQIPYLPNHLIYELSNEITPRMSQIYEYKSYNNSLLLQPDMCWKSLLTDCVISFIFSALINHSWTLNIQNRAIYVCFVNSSIYLGTRSVFFLIDCYN